MAGKYTKAQLQHGGDTKAEYERLRNIFNDLVTIGKKGKSLSMAEKDFVYSGLRFDKENVDNYSFVEDSKFKDLYLTYFLDISGGSIYYKARKGRVIEVPLHEKQHDLKYLIAKAEEWEKRVAPGMHSERLLQEVSKEANQDKKDLDKTLNVNGDPYLAGSFYYQYKVWGTYLRSRIAYIFSKEYLEETDSADLISSLCGETIEFTEFSMVHILNRHFAEITKQFKSGKDYHNEDFVPRILPKQIKEIITEIDNSGLLTRQHKTEINLRYKGQIYQLWAEWKNRSVKGHHGSVRYKRLQSFFPVTDQTVLAKLNSSFNEVSLTSDLSLFIPILKYYT
jgi:hypothetical protein